MKFVMDIRLDIEKIILRHTQQKPSRELLEELVQYFLAAQGQNIAERGAFLEYKEEVTKLNPASPEWRELLEKFIDFIEWNEATWTKYVKELKTYQSLARLVGRGE